MDNQTEKAIGKIKDDLGQKIDAVKKDLDELVKEVKELKAESALILEHMQRERKFKKAS